MPEVDQVLLAKARLVQEHPHVEDVAHFCSGDPAPGVNQLTAAIMYAACGCRITRCRKVVQEARTALRGHPGAPGFRPGQTETHRERYRQALLANVLVLAKRTTAPRQRRGQKGQP